MKDLMITYGAGWFAFFVGYKIFDLILDALSDKEEEDEDI